MDELIDILDAQGQPTAKTAMKSEAHLHGWFHASVHVWCYTPTGYILLQQRAASKASFPLLWDVSVAGHIAAKEPILTAALREMEEEIGHSTTADSLEKIGVFKSMQQHSSSFIDHEFHHSFLCQLPQPIKSLQKQESEVAALQWLSIKELKTLLTANNPRLPLVPHAPAYYQAVFNAIEERLTAF